MGYRINAEVVYFKSNKNSCLLQKLREIDPTISIDRKGAKKQKRVRYAIQGFSSTEDLEEVKEKIEDLLEEAPIKDWSTQTVAVTT